MRRSVGSGAGVERDQYIVWSEVRRGGARQMRDWQIKGLVDYQPAVSVNLSGKQFAQPGLLEQVKDVLNETGLSGQCLELEITESVIMENADAACETLRELRALGVSLSIDDFGTGYSSLSYLHRFPISALKIDRSFIGNDDNSGIVGTIITLADKLGMEVIAEGSGNCRTGCLLERPGLRVWPGLLAGAASRLSRYRVAAAKRRVSEYGKRRGAYRKL